MIQKQNKPQTRHSHFKCKTCMRAMFSQIQKLHPTDATDLLTEVWLLQ